MMYCGIVYYNVCTNTKRACMHMNSWILSPFGDPALVGVRGGYFGPGSVTSFFLGGGCFGSTLPIPEPVTQSSFDLLCSWNMPARSSVGVEGLGASDGLPFFLPARNRLATPFTAATGHGDANLCFSASILFIKSVRRASLSTSMRPSMLSLEKTPWRSRVCIKSRDVAFCRPALYLVISSFPISLT